MARLRVVMGEPRRLVGQAVGEVVLQHMGYPGVQFDALAFEQRVIRGILDQCMLEGVDDVRRCVALCDQPGRDQFLE